MTSSLTFSIIALLTRFEFCIVDGAGWLPTSIQNMVNSYAPYGVIGIRKLATGSTQPVAPKGT